MAVGSDISWIVTDDAAHRRVRSVIGQDHISGTAQTRLGAASTGLAAMATAAGGVSASSGRLRVLMPYSQSRYSVRLQAGESKPPGDSRVAK